MTTPSEPPAEDEVVELEATLSQIVAEFSPEIRRVMGICFAISSMTDDQETKAGAFMTGHSLREMMRSCEVNDAIDADLSKELFLRMRKAGEQPSNPAPTVPNIVIARR